jgi:hypothetical protein
MVAPPLCYSTLYIPPPPQRGGGGMCYTQKIHCFRQKKNKCWQYLTENLKGLPKYITTLQHQRWVRIYFWNTYMKIMQENRKHQQKLLGLICTKMHELNYNRCIFPYVISMDTKPKKIGRGRGTGLLCASHFMGCSTAELLLDYCVHRRN